MSKRGMDSQGGEERYGAMEGQGNDAGVEKPQAATAAQLARRKILNAKGRGTPRGARAGSPAVAGPPAANPFQQQSFQAFQPQQSSFEFNVPGSTPAPTFGAAPQQHGGMFGAQPKNTPSFGGFGNGQANGTPAQSFGSNASAQLQTNGFAPSASFAGFGQSQNTTTTPASSFTFGQTPSQSQEQPKSNPFATPASNAFANLGTQQPQQNGTSFGQSQQEATSQPSAPIFNFGQSQTPAEKSATAGLFGATTAASQPNGTTPAPASTGLFGSQPAAAPATTPGESIFSGLNSTSSTLKPNMFSSQQPSRSPSPFGEPQQNGTETPKPATNPFANFSSQPKTNGEQTSQPSTSFFAAPKDAQANGVSTPMPATPFAGFNFGQAKQQEVNRSDKEEGAAQKKPVFSFGQTPSKPEQTSKASMFGSQTPSQAPATSPFKFNASQQEDTSMVTPGNTPQKPSFQPPNSFNTAAGQSEASTSHHEPDQSSRISNAGNSIFDRISRDPPPVNQTAFSFSTPGGSTSVEREDLTSSVTGKSLFDHISSRDPKPQSQQSANAPPISFGQADNSTTFSHKDVQGSAMSAQPASTRAEPQLSQPARALFYASSSTSTVSADRKKLKLLNEGLVSHLKTQDPNKDWTVLFQYYIQQAANVMGSEAVRMPTAATQPSAPKSFMPPPPASIQHTSMQPKAPTTPSQPSASSTGSFGIMQHPPPGQRASATKTPSASNIFSQAAQPPATAPVNRKRSADGDITAPATEQRAKPDVSYTKLPETASNTAKLFASTLDKQKAPASASNLTTNGGASNTFKPSTAFSFGASTLARNAGGSTETPATSFKPTPAAVPVKPVEDPKTPAFGFKPPAPAGTSMTNGGFKPLFAAPPAAGASSFLSAFGKKADASLEEAKRKRMDEDYDSDEDDKASWEAKDKAEQEAKRRKIEEAAKSASGFKVPTAGSSASSAPFAFNVPAAVDASTQHDESSNPNAGKSMFDRLSPADKTPAPAATPSLFSASISKPTSMNNLFSPKPGLSSGFKFGAPTPAKDAATAEKEQGTGDKAWTPNTPIKFSSTSTAIESTTPAAPPPAFSNLFGASNKTPAQNSETGKLAPPALGFTFGAPKGVSTDVSRATTPGVTTDGEASVAGDNPEGEPSEQQIDQQVEDMTALMPAERADEDVLFEASMAKAQKVDQKQDDNGNNVTAYVDRGKGPLYILKNKSTGKIRMLMKIPPLGRLAMNFSPIPGMNYTCAPGRKIVLATFLDHFDNNKERAGRPSSWSIQVREPKDAQEIARILTEAVQ
ncbi:hypothetical protein LTR78_006064 [Recurvomyces mirabilis]|uniref:RanBD1 domain-containing protein n=1 Tax=Recurvomyces mirabilis TaxID=574656 RepID=A0AAE0WM35_9PEZI|nr:hypothetical protein LTR78_006064 [Recurvomyces mirabilis]KAK5155125.1 hypothetical protein LTS14_006080 [Recurvomyces mirabilis]